MDMMIAHTVPSISRRLPNPRWTSYLLGRVVKASGFILERRRVNPTRAMGLANRNLMEAWKLGVPLWEMSVELGFLILVSPIWGLIPKSWMIGLLLTAREMEKGVLEEERMFCLKRSQVSVIPAKIGWNLRWRAGIRPLFDEVLPPIYELTMNIIAWNCRGALKPNFQSNVHDLVRLHDHVVFVVTETRVGGGRAKDITDRLPFDGAIRSDAVGFTGGIWLLWNSDRVEINTLAITEQEI
ncbi:uncharacterized protein LOC142619233 [Castanea sativa]|uniref:uncharacterized protein LOC142619233 n=1 Tax=Castanea sativa TaxID=21020 RepID=UPI003F649529